MKSIKLNFLYNIILNLSRIAFPLITAPYVARVLEPDGVGLANFANSYASYFALFAALGTQFYGSREVSKIRDDIEQKKQFVSQIFSLLICTSLFFSVVYVFSLLWVQQLNKNMMVFLVAGIVLFSTPFKIDWFFAGLEEFGFITLRSMIIKVLGVAFLFIFVHEKSDLLIYVFLTALAVVLNELWNFFKLMKMGVRLKFTIHFSRHVKPLLILFSSAVAISVYTILDTLMLGFMREYSEVAYYNSSSHIARSFLAVTTSLSAVAIPRMSYYVKNGKWSDINDLMKKSMSIIGFLSFPIAIGTVAIAPDFVPLFFGSKFYGAIIPLQIMIFVVVVIGLNNLTGSQILIGLGLDKFLLISVSLGAVANFCLNVFFIPKYGASGAAFTSVIAEILILIMTSYFVIKKTSIRFGASFKDLLFSALSASIFLPVTLILKNYIEGWCLVFAVFFVAGAAYIALQYLLKNKSIIILLNVILDKIKKEKRTFS